MLRNPWFLYPGLLLLAWSHVASAADASYEENRLDALHYRIPKGDFFLGAAWGQFLNDKTTSSPGGGIYTYHGFFAGGSVGYGITDSLSVMLGYDVWFGSNPISAAMTPFKMDDVYGAILNYRYLGGLTGRVFGSAYLNVIPPFGNESSYANEGSFNAGQTSVVFGTHLHWVVGVHEFGADASGTYGGPVTFTDNEPGNRYTNTSTSFWLFDVTEQYRFHFLDRFFVAPFLSVISPYNIAYTYPNEGYQETHYYPWRVSEGLQLGWLIRPMLGLGLAYTHNGYTKTITPIVTSGQASSGYSYNQDALAIVAALQL